MATARLGAPVTQGDESIAEITDAARAALAVESLVLLATQNEWIHRRVENVELLDGKHVRRRVTIDYSLQPVGTDRISALAGHRYVPIALFRKDDLVNLQITNGDGSAVPVLTKEENGRISHRMLLHTAFDSRWWGPMTVEAQVDLASKLLDLAQRPDQGYLFNELFRAPASADRPWLEDRVFRGLASRLADNFVLFVRGVESSAERQFVTIEYDASVSGESGLWAEAGGLRRRTGTAVARLVLLG